MPSSQILFAELHEPSPTINNRRQPSILTRRQRTTTTENLSPIQQVSDITNLLPSQFTFRNVKVSRNASFERSSPRLKPLNYSKTLAEHTHKPNVSNSKSSQSVTAHTWTPKLSESNSFHTRTLTGLLRARSQLTKYTHQQYPKTNYFQDLYISPRILNTSSNENELNRKVTNTKFVIDECKSRKKTCRRMN